MKKITKIILFSFFVFLYSSFIPIKKISKFPNEYQEKIIHEGELIIGGNEIFTIDNMEFTQHGNVRIYGKLSIQNSTFIMQLAYHEEFSITLYGNGIIEILDSNVDSSYCFMLSLNENSKCKIINTEVKNSFIPVGGNIELTIKNLPDTSHINLLIGHNAYAETDVTKIYVEDSYVHELGFWLTANHEIELANIKENSLNNFDIVPAANGKAPFDIHFKNTRIFVFDIAALENSKFRAINSEIFSIGFCGNSNQRGYTENSTITSICVFGAGYSNLEFEGLKKGYFENFNLGEHGSGFNYQLQMLRTTIRDGWTLKTDVAEEAIIKNSELSCLRPFSGTYKVYDSVLNEFWSYHFGYYSSHAEVIWDNSIIKKWTNHLQCVFNFKGYVKIESAPLVSPGMGPCLEAKVNREFPVWTYYGCNKIASVDLQVFDPQGNEIWSGSSNETGEAFFNVAFDCSNYNKEYKLRSQYLGSEIKFKLGSSTPLIIPQYSLILTSQIGGTTNPVPGTYTFDPGTEVTIVASPESGYRFQGWSGDASGTSNPITITMDSNQSIKANFIRQYTLTLASGTDGTTDPAPGSYKYDTEGQVSIKATPNNDYKFSHWSGDVPQGNEKDNPLIIIMDSDKSITANFTRQYKLTMTAGAGGTTDPTPGSYVYDSGTQVSVKAIPEIGFRFTGWSGDVSETTNPITIIMDRDKSITANFIRQYTLTISLGVGGTTDPAPGTYIYDSGTKVTIKAMPNNGYRFSGWSGSVKSTDNSISVTMDSDKSITANFIRQHTLTIASGSGGTTDPMPGAYTYDTGSQATIRAIPNSGYQFSGWSGDASGTTNPITITMDSDNSVTANFKNKGLCFIATAAYGSSLHSSVRTLQDFRDRYLMTSKVGRALVRFYYRHSPPAADFIARHRALKIAVQAVLLPLVAFSYLMLRFGPVITAVMFSLIFVLPVFLVRLYRRMARRARMRSGSIMSLPTRSALK
jgi:uncharacterized repeat protein (TIGR02543 family)